MPDTRDPLDMILRLLVRGPHVPPDADTLYRLGVLPEYQTTVAGMRVVIRGPRDWRRRHA